MELSRYEHIEAFYERAAPFLLEREADHNLSLGLSGELLNDPNAWPGPLYLATVEEGGTVVATAMRTPPFNLVLSHLPGRGAAEALARDLLGALPDLPGVSGPGDAARTMAELWQAHSGRPFHQTVAMGIYRLTRVIAPAPVAGSLRRAHEDDRTLMGDWIAAFQEETFGHSDRPRLTDAVERWLTSSSRGLYFWEIEGRPVAMAGYTGPTPNGIRIGAVYTPPDQRRRGYASALVAALSQMLLDQGRSFCFLFTDLANPTSNKIYRAIGYEHVCDAAEYLFDGV